MKKNSYDVTPKKHLGQHFLTDENIAREIVESLITLPAVDHVLEIGPGMGALTVFLTEHPINLHLIEIDEASVIYLEQHFPLLKNKIIKEDFLALDFSKLPDPIAIIGNFPYHISSQILFKVLDNREQVSVMVGMFQKEVASRITSPPGGREYGIPSVLLQAWYDVEYLFSVDKTKFNPPPKVQSGVIRLIRNKRKDIGCDELVFKRIVKQAFNQRRKILRNSLKSQVNAARLEQMPFSTLRPEQLSWQQFSALTNFINESH